MLSLHCDFDSGGEAERACSNDYSRFRLTYYSINREFGAIPNRFSVKLRVKGVNPKEFTDCVAVPNETQDTAVFAYCQLFAFFRKKCLRVPVSGNYRK